MQRNWDTIREILSKLEEATPEQVKINLMHFPQEKAFEISYHMELLLDAGLVKGEMRKELRVRPQDFIVYSLTWQGHEFLDTIRSDTVWQNTKKSFQQNSISMTFDLIKSVATGIATAFLKSRIGV